MRRGSAAERSQACRKEAKSHGVEAGRGIGGAAGLSSPSAVKGTTGSQESHTAMGAGLGMRLGAGDEDARAAARAHRARKLAVAPHLCKVEAALSFPSSSTSPLCMSVRVDRDLASNIYVTQAYSSRFK